jgi:hypothetical protein
MVVPRKVELINDLFHNSVKHIFKKAWLAKIRKKTPRVEPTCGIRHISRLRTNSTNFTE